MNQAEMVKRWVLEHGEIRRADVMDLCQLSSDQAKRLLASLTAEGFLDRTGSGRGVRYRAGRLLGQTPNGRGPK